MEQTHISTQQTLNTQQQQLQELQQKLKALAEQVALHSTCIASTTKVAYEKAVEKYQKKLLEVINRDIQRGKDEEKVALQNLDRGIHWYKAAYFHYQVARGHFEKAFQKTSKLRDASLSKDFQGKLEQCKSTVEAMINRLEACLQSNPPQIRQPITSFAVTPHNSSKS
ncbi:MAG: hypothetical protein AAFQ78_01490 [Bacteroidota bacterium]